MARTPWVAAGGEAQPPTATDEPINISETATSSTQPRERVHPTFARVVHDSVVARLLTRASTRRALPSRVNRSRHTVSEWRRRGEYPSLSTSALLPPARGPFSEAVLGALARQPGTLGSTPPVGEVDSLRDDDFCLALYLCYELHYRGVGDADWEWDPDLLRFRLELERCFVQRLRDEVTGSTPRRANDVTAALEDVIHSSAGPSLSGYLAEAGTFNQLREFCIHRSAYQLKEADPHTFAIPRLTGRAKAAMVEIQYDEYGSGDVAQMHSVLFGDTLRALDLNTVVGSYIPLVPGTTLATVNLVSMFGLHRRWRAALVGHLAVFEMTSVEPMARYARALTRHGVNAKGRQFFDVHVTADERHALIARDELVAGLVDADPTLAGDLLFGASSLLMLEGRFATHLLDSWAQGQSSLLDVTLQ